MKIKKLPQKILLIVMVLILAIVAIPSSALEKQDGPESYADLKSVNCRVFKMSENAVRQKFSEKDLVKTRADNLSASAGKFKYNGYSHLNSVQRNCYDKMVKAAKDLNPQPFLVVENTKDFGCVGDIELVFMTVMADHPEIFWLDGGLGIGYDEYTDGSYDFYMIVSYIIDSKTELAQRISALNQKVNTLVSKVKGMTDYDKELYFHDYLCDTITFTNEDETYCYTCYGALVNGESVCEGYAESMQLLLNTCDVNCVTVRGSEKNGGGHMWNMVELPTGWHELDVTWDDYYGITRYDYFNVTDSQISKDHIKSIIYNENNIPEDFGASLEFNFCLPSAEHSEGNGGEISGKIVCAGGKTDGAKLSFYLNSTKELFSEMTISANSNTYLHRRLPAGDYTVKVSKDGYVPREYSVTLKNSNLALSVQINHIGDFGGNGTTDKLDLIYLKSHINRTKTLSDYSYQVMDINANGTVDKLDLIAFKRHLNKSKPLW